MRQIGRPVVEDLKPSDPHLLFLNVDPAVRDDVVPRFPCGVVAEAHFIEEQSHRDEIPVGEGFRRFADLLGHIVHSGDQVAYWNGGEKGVAPHFLNRSIFPVFHFDDLSVFRADPGDFRMKADPSSAFADLLRHALPVLTGSALGIFEGFNQRRLLFPAERSRHRGEQRLPQRKPLHSLPSPVRSDLRWRNSP